MGKIAGLLWRASTAAARARLKAAGVKVGRGAVFHGQPIVSRAENSRIELGDRVVLTSRSRDTALGVRSPVIIRSLAANASIRIGDDCGISGGAICAAKSIVIGQRCLIGADCMIFDTDFHNRDPHNRRYSAPRWDQISKEVTIGDDVFIGTRATIMKGARIGDGCIIGAGSVVTGTVPSNSLFVGSYPNNFRIIPLNTGEA